MYHRAVVKGRRCGPHAGECPRPRILHGLGKDAVFFFLTPHKDIRHSAVDKMSMKYLNIDDLIVTHDCIFVMTSLVECIYVVFSL